MTPGQRKWLERLRDFGPQVRPRYGARPCRVCCLNGWSRWKDFKTTTEEITEAGLDALIDEIERLDRREG